MMVVAPVAAAAMIAAVPTAPVPNTATVSPAATPREFKMAPAPVDRPQPKGPRNTKGRGAGVAGAGEVFVVEILAVGGCSVKALQALAARIKTQNDFVTGFYSKGSRANGEDFADAFVAIDGRQKCWIDLVTNDCVG